MRFWFGGPRFGFIRPGISVGPGDLRGFGQLPRTGTIPPCIYAVAGEHGMTKIGISNSPTDRLATLQTGSAHALVLTFAAFPSGDAYALEQEAHAILGARRVNGEWFNASPEMAAAAIYAAAERVGQSLQPLDPNNPDVQRFLIKGPGREPAASWLGWLIILMVGASILHECGFLGR